MTYDTNLAEAIEAIAALAQKESLPLSDRVSFEKLPDTIVPKGATANEIYVAIKVRPSGEAEITSIKSLIDEYRSKPVRRGGTAHVTTLESFVNLVNRHKGTNSAIFANISWKNPVFTAILDYHHANSVRAQTRTAKKLPSILTLILVMTLSPVLVATKLNISFLFPKAGRPGLKPMGKITANQSLRSFSKITSMK